MQKEIVIQAMAKEATEVDEGRWSRGIMDSNNQWYNAEAPTEEEASKFFKDGTFAKGKKVTLVLEKGKKGPLIVGVLGHPTIPSPEQTPPKTEQKPEFLIDLVKATLMPRIHVGIDEEKVLRIIKCGNYDKVITRKYMINLSVNSESVTPKDIKDLMDMAEAEIKRRGAGQ